MELGLISHPLAIYHSGTCCAVGQAAHNRTMKLESVPPYPVNVHAGFRQTNLVHNVTLKKVGPIFPNSRGNPLSLGSVVNRIILPALNRCGQCGKTQADHKEANHNYERDVRIPEWHGWHAARRGLGSNLYRLGVPEMVIQRILRHANVSTTVTYYIKTAADDVKHAMQKLENNIPQAPQVVRDTYGTLKASETHAEPTIQ
jgi:hypothetical protein